LVEADDAGDPRHARGDLGAPEDLVGVGAVGGRPDVGDVERRLDEPLADLGAEHPVEEIRFGQEYCVHGTG